MMEGWGRGLFLQAMPLIAWLVAAYLAGSLAGFTKAASAAAATAACAFAAAALLSRPRAAVACIVFAAGAFAASTWSRSQRSCAAIAATGSILTLELFDEASPGAFAHARTPCGAWVSVFVAKGRAAAGATVRAEGTATLSPDSSAVTLRGAIVQQLA